MSTNRDAVYAMTARARRFGLAGRFGEAHALLDEAGELAEGCAGALASCAIERGRLHNSAGFPQEALPFFLKAWDLAREAGEHGLAVDAAHMVAIVAPVDEAAAWVRTALTHIEAHPGTEHWRGPLYNNLGWSYFEAARFEEALAAFRQGVVIREASGQPRELRIARYTVIRCLRALARYEEAIALAEMVVTLADAGGEAAPFVYEELAECHAATRDEAKASFYAGRAVAAFEHDVQFRSNETARFERLIEIASGLSPAAQQI